jgi:hypothetical protein
MRQYLILRDLCIDHLLKNDWVDYYLLPGFSSQWVPAMVSTILEDTEFLSLQKKRREVVNSLIRANPALCAIGYNEKTPPDCDSTTWFARSLLSINITPPDHLYKYILSHAIKSRYSTYTPADQVHNYIGHDLDSCRGWLTGHDCVTMNVHSLLNPCLNEHLDFASFHPYWWADPIIPVLLCISNSSSLCLTKLASGKQPLISIPSRWQRYNQYSNMLRNIYTYDVSDQTLAIDDASSIFETFGCIMQLPNPNMTCQDLNPANSWIYGGLMQGSRVVDINKIVSSALFLKIVSYII